MIAKILIVVAVVVVIFVAVVALQPGEFRISRSTTIAASPTAVFSLVNDFHSWAGWSPWAKLDPTMKTTYEGPAAGTGAAYSWTGNSKVGEGRMQILDSRPGEVVHIRLDFIKPFASTNSCVFTFAPNASGTEVTWTMSGRNNFMGKAFGLFMNVDKMVGGDFERGLAGMRAIAEKK
jgi:uncharacterized protein YndB with AHSA1/START domain